MNIKRSGGGEMMFLERKREKKIDVLIKKSGERERERERERGGFCYIYICVERERGFWLLYLIFQLF